MASVSAIRDGLRDRLTTIPGLRAHDTIPGNINPPAALISLARLTYDRTFDEAVDRMDEYEFAVRVYVAPAADAQSQERLDEFLAPTGGASVKAAIEADGTLGGVVDDSRVTEVTGPVPAIYEHGGVEYIGAEFTVLVIG